MAVPTQNADDVGILSAIDREFNFLDIEPLFAGTETARHPIYLYLIGVDVSISLEYCSRNVSTST